MNEQNIETKDLIIIEQMPIIKEQLQSLKVQIQKEVEEARALVCTEDSKKLVKEKRAELNKKFKILEAKRIEVKNNLEEPYKAFLTIYKDCVTNVFEPAFLSLDSKISVIEDAQKLEKETEVKAYFEEFKTSLAIDFLEFEDTKVKVGLANTLPSLKKEVKEFLNKVKEDLDLIETQENKTEILVEYKRSLNVSQAITTVSNRIKQIAEEKERQAKLEELKNLQKQAVEKVENIVEVLKAPIQAPIVEQEKESVSTKTFEVTATWKEFEKLKMFLSQNDYFYWEV